MKYAFFAAFWCHCLFLFNGSPWHATPTHANPASEATGSTSRRWRNPSVRRWRWCCSLCPPMRRFQRGFSNGWEKLRQKNDFFSKNLDTKFEKSTNNNKISDDFCVESWKCFFFHSILFSRSQTWKIRIIRSGTIWRHISFPRPRGVNGCQRLSRGQDVSETHRSLVSSRWLVSPGPCWCRSCWKPRYVSHSTSQGEGQRPVARILISDSDIIEMF